MLIGKRIKEVEAPSAALNTSLFFSDLAAVGVTPNTGVIAQEMNALPSIVKNEASTVLVSGAIGIGKVFGMNGDTKSIEGFTFTRNSAATRWASDGKIYTVLPNEIRYDQDPKSGAFKGILFEKASTNLLTRSGFERGMIDVASSSAGYVNAVDTSWNKGALLEKGIMIERNSSGPSWVYKQFTGPLANTSYTFSCYIRMADGLNPVGGIKINMFNALYGDFNVEDVGGGIFRVSITKKMLAGGNAYVGVVKEASGDNRTVVVSGYQLEESELHTSYIPTDIASATRLEDVLSSDRPIDVFNEYSLFMVGQYVSSRAELQSSVFVSKDINSRYLYHTYSLSDPSNIRSFNGISPLRLFANENEVLKIVVRRDVSKYSLCVNGGSIQEELSPFPLSDVKLAIRGSSGSFILRSLAIIPRKLTDQELQTITS